MQIGEPGLFSGLMDGVAEVGTDLDFPAISAQCRDMIADELGPKHSLLRLRRGHEEMHTFCRAHFGHGLREQQQPGVHEISADEALHAQIALEATHDASVITPARAGGATEQREVLRAVFIADPGIGHADTQTAIEQGAAPGFEMRTLNADAPQMQARTRLIVVERQGFFFTRGGAADASITHGGQTGFGDLLDQCALTFLLKDEHQCGGVITQRS